MEQLYLQAYLAMRISRLLSVFVLLLPLQTFAEVYDVSTTAELREALASAAEAGGDNTIRLAAGTYSTQDDGEGVFEYISQKAGQLNIVSKDSDATSILDGSSVDSILLIAVYAETDLLLRGLQFRNSIARAISVGDTPLGELTVEQAVFSNNLGGGIECRADACLIFDSDFVENNAERGGAITTSASLIRIVRSNFTDNSADREGGAIHISRYNGELEILRSSFTRNAAGNGGAIYSVQDVTGSISESRFDANSATWSFAAHAVVAFPIELKRNLFENHINVSNHEQHFIVRGAGGELVNNIFRANDGADVLPSSRTKRVTNNLFENTSLNLWHESVSVSNNVFFNNEQDIKATADQYPHLTFLNNNVLDLSKVSETILIDGSNNIFEGVNLGFVNSEAGDYRLTSSSGLIDAGTTDPELAYITDYDYTGTTARVIGASVDIGPYEYDGEAPPDSDGDGLNDNIDNCPEVANEDQADFDSDGEGDVCDSDDDNDGTNDEDDAFPFDASESLDTDGDGIGNNEDYDDDADGILDSFDNAPLVVNTIVVDSDNDGVIDSVDAYPNDSTKQYSGSDDLDGDGYSNDEEVDYCSNPFDKNSQPELSGLSMPMIHLLTEQ